MDLFGPGDGEEELVFPVAADAGGAELANQFDDPRRVWTCVLLTLHNT